jgi:hypothetical protein
MASAPGGVATGRFESLLGLQRLAGNAAVASMIGGRAPATESGAGVRDAGGLVGQARLLVGQVDDPHEREADRVAGQVVSALRAAPAGEPTTVETGRGGGGPALRRRATPVAGRGGTPLEAGTDAAIRQARGGGAVLGAPTRASFEAAFGGADLSGVRVHSGPAATELNERVHATAFTVGHDIFFRDALPDTTTATGQELMAHELTHTIQQGPAGQTGGLRVQRHASDEHLALGEVPPDKLEGLANARELYANLKQQRGGAFTLDDRKDPGGVIRDAIHLLQVERDRLRRWQSQMPQTTGVDAASGVRIVKVDSHQGGSAIGTYGELNTLPDYFGNTTDLRSISAEHMTEVLQTLRQEYYDWLGKFLLELTERDYVIKEVEVTKVDSDGDTYTVKERQEFYRGEPLQPEDKTAQAQQHGADQYNRQDRLNHQEFAGSQTGFALADLGRPKAALGSYFGGMKGASVPVDVDAGMAARKTGGAWGSLARNACHFAPFSWDSWRTYHLKALGLATEAHTLRQEAEALKAKANTASEDDQPGMLKAADDKEKLAAEKENEAFVENGFGDHYLQDSFAAGHLMNKTLVMQWWTEFMKDNWKVLGASGNEATRNLTMSATAQPGLGGSQLYGQGGARGRTNDPQAVANIGEGGGRAAMFAASGLQVPSSLTAPGITPLLQAWITNPRPVPVPTEEGDNPEAAHEQALQVADLARISGLSAQDTQTSLTQLVGAGLVTTTTSSRLFGGKTTYRLNLAPTIRAKLLDAEKNNQPVQPGQAANPVQTMLMGNYEEWLYSSTVQMGSKILHDYFCKNGLMVRDDEHDDLYKIYGDYALLDAQSAKGVKFAAGTSRASQDDIAGRVAGGTNYQARTDEIWRRLPKRAVTPSTITVPGWFGENQIQVPAPDAGKELPLDQWLTRLKPSLMALFASLPWADARNSVASRTALAKTPTNAGTLLPHEGELF